MRVLLRVFVLATAAVVWAAVAWMPGAARTASRPAPAETALALPPVPSSPDRPGEDCAQADAEEAPATARIEVAAAPSETPPEDGLPVDIVLVDGERGDVLRCTTTTVPRGPEATLDFRITAPAGFVADTDRRQITAKVSRRAERLRVVEPLRHEADIRVRVVDASGRPAQGARVTGVFLGGLEPSIVPGLPLPFPRAAPTGADGWTRLHGVPHFLDQWYWIVAAKGNREAYTELRLGAFGEAYASEIRLPETDRVDGDLNIGLGGGAGGGYRSGRSGHRIVRQVPATLSVLVFREDGRMGVGLDVFVGSISAPTDSGGRATFPRLPPGTYTVEVRDPDFVWSKASVDLTSGEYRTFVLEEVPAWTATVLLRDSCGRPVPFAYANVSSDAPVPYLCVEDGVQDLVFWTDANGELRLPGLHHAPVRVAFYYGSRNASVIVEESDARVTVDLPAP